MSAKRISNKKSKKKMVPGMGGAMGLVMGSKTVIVAMTHTAKGGIAFKRNCKVLG